MYEAQTRGIFVRAEPRYIEARSSPDSQRYFWAYRIEIENRSPMTVQLRTRYWKITDAAGRVEEVRGAGVVGETPVIRPGETYAYTSGCPLTTPSGIMVGHYGMVSPDGEAFDIAIPAFSLDSPDSRRTLN
ncbi:MAG: Co2+/Mg2+ efflux protein ApaG [Hyphomicrobiaceae bacterium]|nr:Co2+/Mg2+ efflux protein ApaG [Hyphomicrobiaceae bacterium]